MSINKWMEKGYTDDGCSSYLCLKCYNGWESRTGCAYTNERGYFYDGFTYCPCCGTKWEEQQEKVYKRHHGVFTEEEWFKHLQELPSKSYYDVSHVTAWWILEKRMILTEFEWEEVTGWKPVWKAEFGGVHVWNTLAAARREPIDYRRLSPAARFTCKEDVEEWKKNTPEEPTEEVRLVRVKAKDYEDYRKKHGFIANQDEWQDPIHMIRVFHEPQEKFHPSQANPFLKVPDVVEESSTG